MRRCKRCGGSLDTAYRCTICNKDNQPKVSTSAVETPPSSIAPKDEMVKELDAVLNLFQADLEHGHMNRVCRTFMEKYGWQVKARLSARGPFKWPQAFECRARESSGKFHCDGITPTHYSCDTCVAQTNAIDGTLTCKFGVPYGAMDVSAERKP